MKDYAKRPQTVRKKQPQNKNSVLICVTVCAVGAFIFFTDHLLHEFALTKKTAQTQPISLAAQKPVEKITHKRLNKKIAKNTVKQAQKDLSPVADNQPKYDFYKLLPKMTVVIPADNDSKE